MDREQLLETIQAARTQKESVTEEAQLEDAQVELFKEHAASHVVRLDDDPNPRLATTMIFGARAKEQDMGKGKERAVPVSVKPKASSVIVVGPKPKKRKAEGAAAESNKKPSGGSSSSASTGTVKEAAAPAGLSLLGDYGSGSSSD